MEKINLTNAERAAILTCKNFLAEEYDFAKSGSQIDYSSKEFYDALDAMHTKCKDLIGATRGKGMVTGLGSVLDTVAHGVEVDMHTLVKSMMLIKELPHGSITKSFSEENYAAMLTSLLWQMCACDYLIRVCHSETMRKLEEMNE